MNNIAKQDETSDLIVGRNYRLAEGNLDTQIAYGHFDGYGIVEVYLGETAEFGVPPVATVDVQEGEDPSLLAAAFQAYTQGYAECLTNHPDVPEQYDIAELCQNVLRFLSRYQGIPLRIGKEHHIKSKVGEDNVARISSCCGSITVTTPGGEEWRKCARFEHEAAKFEGYVLGYTDALHAHELSGKAEREGSYILYHALEEAKTFPVDSHTV